MKKILTKRKYCTKVLCLLLACIMTISLTGCSDASSTGSIVSYSLTADPKNLDPQIATDTNAKLIISNLFEGLVTKDAQGNVIPGAAQSYEVSQDGLTYTFHIREGVVWKYYTKDNTFGDNKEPLTAQVTANDFVFAFQRLLSPSTASPYAENYYCIQNAQAVNQGKKGVESLGVQAPDALTLVIQLAYPNPLFLDLLTDTPSMPCNQDFFNKTNGRYGLSYETVLCNGPFYLSEWSNASDNNYVRIRKNENYRSSNPVSCAGANLTVRSTDDAISAFANQDIDTILVDQNGREQIGGNLPVISCQNSVTGLIFNQTEEHFANENIRKALVYDLNRDDVANYLPSGSTIANDLVPPSIEIGEENYRETAGDGFVPAYDPSLAKQLLDAGMKQLKAKNPKIKDLNSLSLLVAEGYEQTASRILQIWQKDLGVYIQLDVQPLDKCLQRIASGDYACALVSIQSITNSPESLLSQFTSTSSQNVSRYSSQQFDALMKQAASQPDIQSMVNTYAQAEQQLLGEAVFAPLFYQEQFFITQNGVKDLRFDAGSQILYFQYAKK